MPKVSLSEHAHQVLKKIAAECGQSIGRALEDAVENYRRYSLLRATNGAFAILRADAAAWAQELEERQISGAAFVDISKRE